METLKAYVESLDWVRNEIGSKFTCQQLYFFGIIATNEGITYTDIERITGMPNGAISKHCKTMSRYKDTKGKAHGLDLLAMGFDPDDTRRKAVFLSNRGKAVAKKLRTILQKGG